MLSCNCFFWFNLCNIQCKAIYLCLWIFDKCMELEFRNWNDEYYLEMLDLWLMMELGEWK